MFLAVPKLQTVLTKANYINKTDVVTLLETFGNFRNICSATEQQMVLCPGIGEKKVKRLHRALHAPFMLGGEVEEGRDMDHVFNNVEGTVSADVNTNEQRRFHNQENNTSSRSSRSSSISSSGVATEGNFIVQAHPSTVAARQGGKVIEPGRWKCVER